MYQSLFLIFIGSILTYAHNHEVVIMVDNSLSLTPAECIQQQTAISGLFKEYKHLPLNDVSYISFSHYSSDIIQLISFQDTQNNNKSINNLASKIKSFDCNQHALTKKNHHINNYNNSFNQLLNTFKYAISSYQNYSKTKRILLFNNFETSTKSQDNICKYFTNQNKKHLYVPNIIDEIMAIVSVNLMGNGVNESYLNCTKRYIKKSITLKNSSLTAFKAHHDEIILAICPNSSNETCSDCVNSCAGGAPCPEYLMDECDIFTRCTEASAVGGLVCCGSGLIDECCEKDTLDVTTCTPTPVDEFCCNPPTTATPTTATPTTATPTTATPTTITSTPTTSPTKDSSSDDSSSDDDIAMANVVGGIYDKDDMDKSNAHHQVVINIGSRTMDSLIAIVMAMFCGICICYLCKRKAQQTHYEFNS